MSAPTASPVTPDPADPRPMALSVAGRRPWADPLLKGAATASAVLVLVMLAALVTILVMAALPSIQRFGLSFFVGTEWRPNELEQVARDAAGKIIRDEDGNNVVNVVPPVFGALPVMYGTAVSSAMALLLAVPLSFGAALFLVRIAPRWLVAPVSFLVEFLAAIPSIAYGIFGLFLVAPWLQSTVIPAANKVLGGVPGLGWLFHETAATGRVIEFTSGRNMLCAALILAIMIIPIITAISRDVLANVPRAQVEGSLALGATWWQSCVEMLKYGRSALFGAVILGLARAAGETMAVAMVIGSANRIDPSPLAPAQTMASLLANEFQEATELQRGALVEVGLILLIMSLAFNVVARYLVVGKDSRSAMAH